MGDEVGAALGARSGDDERSLGGVERADHGDLLGLPRRRRAQVGAPLGPGAGEVGMGESFALVGEQKHDVASLGLRLAQLEPQADAIDGVVVLTPFQGVARRKRNPLFGARLWKAAIGRS
jgi:hypothetical protein